MEESSTLTLTVEKGPREGETLEFTSRSTIRIGRVVRGNTISIKDPGISSKHLSIKFDPQISTWTLSDLNSSNGTFLNGTQLSPNTISNLSHGDTIKLGEITSLNVKIQTQTQTNNNLLRRNPRRAAAANAKLQAVSENNELENKPRRRGRSKKEEIRESSPEVEIIEATDNVGQFETKKGKQVSTRRTRSSRIDENANLVSDGVRRARNLRDTPLEDTEEVEIIQVSDDVEPKKGKGVSTRRTRSSRIDANANANSSVKWGMRSKRNLRDTQLEEKEEVAKESILNEEAVQVGVGGGEEIDLEKMTLGEWFDYLEVTLPKQIYDATEEIILGMRQTAEKYHEFRLQQKNASEKGPMC